MLTEEITKDAIRVVTPSKIRPSAGACNDTLKAIKEYVLKPDRLGCHLRQMAEQMAKEDWANRTAHPALGQKARDSRLDRAAEAIASFIYLVWGGSGPQEYASGTLAILLRLQARMHGMDSQSTWGYAINAFNTDILLRLARSANLAVDPGLKTALIHRFCDDVSDHEYLHDIVRDIIELHWQRRHSPDSLAAERGTVGLPVGPRGEAVLEKHLQQSANEGLATHIEQSNIGRGNIEHPTDPTIIRRDRIELQLAMGGRNAQTWAASGRQIANQIETRLGTTAGRKEARRARHTWKSAAKPC